MITKLVRANNVERAMKLARAVPESWISQWVTEILKAWQNTSTARKACLKNPAYKVTRANLDMIHEQEMLTAFEKIVEKWHDEKQKIDAQMKKTIKWLGLWSMIYVLMLISALSLSFLYPTTLIVSCISFGIAGVVGLILCALTIYAFYSSKQNLDEIPDHFEALKEILIKLQSPLYPQGR